MSEDLENIQAKLCAYLEGELDPGERAQIEKHLAAHPNDRRLVEEMARARQMMRQLPRQSAPPDVAEAIQRQLERSVLLDGDGASDPAVIGRIGRWPQYAAVAAILLLAVGLGAVVYYVVLPPTGGPVAIMQKPTAAPLTEDGQAPVVIGGDEAGGGAIGAEADAASRRAARERRRAAALAGKGGDPDAMAKAAPAAPALSVDDKDLPPAPQAALNQAAAAPARIADAAAIGPSGRAWAVKAKTGDADRLVLVVSTDNPAFANSQVVQYLTSNNIAWSIAPPPRAAEGAAIDQRRANLPQNAKQMSPEAEQLPGGEAGAAVADDDDAARQMQQITQAQIQRQLVDPYADEQSPLIAQQQQQRFQEVPEAAQESLRQQQLGQQLHKGAEQPDGSLAQQQALRQQAKVLANQPAEEQLRPAQPMTQEAMPKAQAFAANRPAAAATVVLNVARREQVIVARGMRPSQAVELRDALTAAGQNAGTQQRVLAYLAADGAPRGIALSEGPPGQQPLALPSSRETGQQHVTTTAPSARTNEQPAAALGPPALADAEGRFPDPLKADAVTERSGGAGRKTAGAAVADPGMGAAAPPTPTTGPVGLRVTEMVSPGDLLSIEIGEPTPTSTLRVQVVPVWSDGTATLPWVGSQAVAGKTVGELQQQLSNAQRAGDGGGAPGAQAPGRVFVRRIGPSAATAAMGRPVAAPAGAAPAAPRADRVPAPALPSPELPLIAQRQQEEELTTATTRPATMPASQPTAEPPAAAIDAPVDLVIIVRGEPAAIPAPAATQPDAPTALEDRPADAQALPMPASNPLPVIQP